MQTKGVGDVFKEVVKAVLLFGLEAWVMTPYMGRNLRGLQNRVARQITGSQPTWQIELELGVPDTGDGDAGGGVQGDGGVCYEEE